MTQKSNKTAVVKPVSTKLILPTEINEPSDNFLDYFILFFGRKNIGKSTLAASYPNAITFMFERGRKNLPILLVSPKTLKEFQEYFKQFLISDLEVGILDTLDAMYEMIYRGVLLPYGVTKPADTGDGPGVWNEIRDVLDEFVGMAQEAGKRLVFVSHEKEKEHSNADGTVLQRIEPSCTGQAIGIVQRYCDFVFHYDWVTNDRVMTLRSTDNIVWTSCGRNDMFLDPDGVPLKRIKIPNDPEEGFNTLEKAFLGELRDYDYVPPKAPKTSPAMKTGKPKK